MTRLVEIRPVRSFQDIIAAIDRAGRRLMDAFGLGAAIDKIEEYLGRRVASVFVFLATIAAIVFFVYAIATYGVLPIAAFVKGVGSQSLIELLRKIGVGVLITVACAIVWSIGMRWFLRSKAEQLFQTCEAIVEKAKQAAEDADARYKKADRAWERVETALRTYEAETGRALDNED